MAHPLEQFHYCPRCGSQRFEENDFKSKRCVDCGFVYYSNAAASTVAVIINENRELLVCRRAMEPAKGTLDLPGGFVDMNETIEEGMVREIKEETSANARVERFLFSLPNVYVFSDLPIHTADCFFLCKLDDEEHLRASDDAASLAWISIEHLDAKLFGLHSISKGVEELLRMDKLGLL